MEKGDKCKVTFTAEEEPEVLVFIESELQDNESLLRDSKRAIDLFPNQPLFYFFYGAMLFINGINKYY